MRNVFWNKFNRLVGEPTRARASGLAFSLAAILPAILSFLLLLFLTLFGLKDSGYQDEDWYLYCNYLLPQFSFAIVALCFLSYLGFSPKTAVQSQKCSFKYFVIALLLQIGLFSLSQLNEVFLQILENFGYQDAGISLPDMDGFGFVGVLLVVAVLPAVFEEIMFRGVLLSGLKSFGKAGAVLLCGALFALYHQNPAQTLYQFCCGVAFALVALRSGSVLPTVLSHFINNAVILILYKCGVETFSPLALGIIIGVSVVCLIAAILWLFLFDKKGEERSEEWMPSIEVRAEQTRFWLSAAAGIAVCALTWVAVLVMGL